MLIGQYQGKLNEKGRCALPAKFKTELGTRLIIAKWYEGCLVCVSEEAWKELLQKLTAKSETLSFSVRETDRFILGSAYDVELDSQGRFVVPKTLREYAGFSEEVTFLGLGDRVEIWESKVWVKREKEVSEKAAERLEEISNKNQ